jgi:hypothetical protein
MACGMAYEAYPSLHRQYMEELNQALSERRLPLLDVRSSRERVCGRAQTGTYMREQKPHTPEYRRPDQLIPNQRPEHQISS